MTRDQASHVQLEETVHPAGPHESAFGHRDELLTATCVRIVEQGSMVGSAKHHTVLVVHHYGVELNAQRNAPTPLGVAAPDALVEQGACAPFHNGHIAENCEAYHDDAYQRRAV
mmetsp:Transcript_55966/g.137457  ORF Transcript_55966/g.137457 Transcript_55966/m.137457 type:complete len:114 (-) Transcript_55966:602-943(-)